LACDPLTQVADAVIMLAIGSSSTVEFVDAPVVG